ncbi:zinc finger, CCHC-type containing protein [Tanacetum coccineum]
MRLRLFQFFLRDQASNWLEHLLAGSISTWEDFITRFLAEFFPPGRTSKLQNDILMFQQHQGWNDSIDLVKPVKAISFPLSTPKTPDRRLLELEDQINYLLKGPRTTPETSSMHVPQAYDKKENGIEGGKVPKGNVMELNKLETLEPIELPDEEEEMEEGTNGSKLTDKEPIGTDVRLSLASHSYIYPLGIAEDLLIDIAGYVYPINFMILDIKEDRNKPFTLETPFLTTTKAVIRFEKGTITLKSGKNKIGRYGMSVPALHKKLRRIKEHYAVSRRFYTPVVEGAPAVEEGAQAIPAPVPPPSGPQAVAPTTRTMPQRMARLEEEVHRLRKSLGGQHEVLDAMSQDFYRFTT